MGTSRSDPFAGVMAYVATAEARSFRAAASQLGVTPSAVSKAIAKLEAELGVRLLHRTSRTVSATPEGETFLRRCRDAVDQLMAARELASQAQRAPRGLLRVSLPPALGRAIVLPALPQLLARHPQLTVEAVLTDRFVRLAEETVDVALRIGKIADASAVARKVRNVRWSTVASPAYLARAGAPRSPDDLEGHNCLAFVLSSGRAQPWAFVMGSEEVSFAPRGNLAADDGQALVGAAVAGLGVLQAHDFMVAEHVARGELVEVLAPHRAPGPPISVLSAPGRASAPKVRAFTQFVVEVVGP